MRQTVTVKRIRVQSQVRFRPLKNGVAELENVIGRCIVAFRPDRTSVGTQNECKTQSATRSGHPQPAAQIIRGIAHLLLSRVEHNYPRTARHAHKQLIA